MKNIKRYLSLMLAIVLLISTISMTGIVTSAAEPSATPYSDRNIVFQWFTRNPNSALTQETVTVDEGVTNTTQGLKITTHSQNGSFNLNFWKETNHAVATDITDIIDDAYVSFYIQLPEGSDNKALKLQLRNNTGKSVTGLYEFTVAKGGEWQEVTVKVSDIPNITEFALDQLYVINVQCPVGQLAIGDQFTVANVHMWHPDTQEDTGNTEDTEDTEISIAPYADRNIVFQWFTRNPNSALAQETVTVDEGATNATQGLKITTHSSNGSFNLNFWKETNHAVATDITDIIDDAYVSFYIQLPEGSDNKALKLQLRNNTGKSVTGLYEFTVAKGGEWQEVTVKVSDIPNITEFALDQLYVINVQCPVGQLAIGDQFTVANVHMWHPDTQEDTPDTPDTPDSSDTTDVPYAERNVLFQWLTRSPSGSYTHEVVNVDESVTNTSQGRKITAGSNGAFDLSFWKELKHGDPTDISAIIDDAYITFYIQLPEGSNNKKLNLSLLNNTWSSTTGNYSTTVAKGGEWQEITIKVSNIPDIATFAQDQLFIIRLTGQLEANDQFTVANVHLWVHSSVELPDPSDKEYIDDGDDIGEAPGPNYEIKEEVLWLWTKRLPGSKDGLVKNEVVEVDGDITGVWEGMQATLIDSDAYRSGKYYLTFWKDKNHDVPTDLTEILDKTYFSFYIKLPEGRDNVWFRMGFYTNTWDSSCNKEFKVEKGGVWQKVTIKMSEVPNIDKFAQDRFYMTMLSEVNEKLLDGDVITIANQRLYTKEWVISSGLYEDDINNWDHPYEAETEVVFAHTTDDNVVKGNAVDKIEKRKDSNGEYFDFAQKVTIGNWRENGEWSAVLNGDSVDLSKIWSTATIRLFAKPSKENSRLTVGLVDKDGKTATTTVLLDSTEAWNEIQIRTSLLKNVEIDKKSIVGIYIGGKYIDLYDDEYLEKGDTVTVGGVEIYSNSPTRKHAAEVITKTFAETFINNKLDVTTGSASIDCINQVNGKYTWNYQTTKDARKGFTVFIPGIYSSGIPFDKDFGYISFGLIANQYVSMNLVVSDGKNTYVRDASAGESWTEYRVYLYDLVNAGLDINNIKYVALQRDRKIGKGISINFTEFTFVSDLTDIPYEFKAIYPIGNSASADNATSSDSQIDNTTDKSPNTGENNFVVAAAVCSLMATGYVILKASKCFR